MLVTFTNTSLTEELVLPFPVSRTIPADDDITVGLTIQDFESREMGGNEPWREFDLLIKQGKLTVVPANDPLTTSILEILRMSNESVEGSLSVTEDLDVGGDTTLGGDADVTGDITAAGGFRRGMGPFVRDNVAANLTDSRAAVGATAAPQVDITVPRAGSVVGLTVASTVAPAGSTLVAKVFKNGVLLDAACILNVPAGATLGHAATFAKDLYTFVAGDRLGVAITTDGSWTSTTADISAEIEIEC